MKCIKISSLYMVVLGDKIDMGVLNLVRSKTHIRVILQTSWTSDIISGITNQFAATLTREIQIKNFSYFGS